MFVTFFRCVLVGKKKRGHAEGGGSVGAVAPTYVKVFARGVSAHYLGLLLFWSTGEAKNA